MSTAPSVSSRIDAGFAQDVREGLLRETKSLPPKYFYDALGSSLFEAITTLPEYGLTRADQTLIRRHAHAIVRAAGAPGVVVELGSGSGKKTGALLRALGRESTYVPIDVSAEALAHCARVLGGMASVRPVEGEFLEGLAQAVKFRRSKEPLLLLFLGSTIGNFERNAARELLRGIHGLLRPGDFLLIGADLLKPVERLVLAYDDPTGVTAAFNRNVLGRINRELGGTFDLRQFRHEARWVEAHHRIEMHLVSEAAHTVSIPGADCTVRFAAGESIWTESSHKYTVDDVAEMARDAGFSIKANWTEEEWGFLESLWQV